ncbi:hypothetical protein JCM24511_03630 [Saitozyma sp. JCM 24511]|nr:hypothetical protein JCM24511_03630 [Saitozyma sp. JCM 24511]
MTIAYEHLSPEQRAHFLDHGWVKVDGGVPSEHIRAWTENAFVRLGWDEHDKSTWTEEAYHMPRHREVKHSQHMPKAWGVASELVGGKDRWDDDIFSTSGDSLIVNVGSEHTAGQRVHPRDTGNWHIDGDWFDHYLDSSDQALLTVCLYTDVVPDGGPTLICPKALPRVLQWLYDHPEGGYSNQVLLDCMKDIDEKDFVYLTGTAGDVFFGHPMMPHSKSRNHLRRFRAICNPTTTLVAPLNFNRQDPDDYSLVEQYTLRALGRWPQGLGDWHIAAERRRYQPRTQAGRDAKVAKELERLSAHAQKTGGTVDSKHLTGERFEHEKLKRYHPPDQSFDAETHQPVKAG